MKMKEQQQKIADKIYETLPSDLEEVISSDHVHDVIIIMTILNKVSTLVEQHRIDDKPMAGKEKKEIVGYIGRLLILNYAKAEFKDYMLEIYNNVVEDVVEIMIDFAKNNKILRKSSRCIANCL